MGYGARGAAFAFTLCAMLFATGCATVVKGRSQILAVNTDPEGASCTLHRNDGAIGGVNPTPGTAQVTKTGAPIDVTCIRHGHLEAKVRVSPSVQGWTAGNAVLGGVVGLIVDAGSGAIFEYPAEVVVKLTPESFSSTALRDAYLDERRAELESDKKVNQADKELLLMEIEDMRDKVRIAGPGEEDPAATHVATQESVGFLDEVSLQDDRLPLQGVFRAGDQWKYRLTDGQRTVSTINVTIVDIGGDKVKERITYEGAKGFLVERQVDPVFDPIRFLDPVALPGGYQLSELAPYFPRGTMLKTGQSWEDVPGDFQILVIGKRTLLSNVRVEGKERIRVPAGSFNAWRIVADVEEASGAQGYRNKLKYQFWYAPESLRVLKIEASSETSIRAHARVEHYELIAIEQDTLQSRKD